MEVAMLPDVQNLTDLDRELDAIRAPSSKLMAQPEAGAEALVTVVVELEKTFNALEGELIRFLSLRFDDKNRAESEREMLEMEAGKIRNRVGEIRAHCSKIGLIYASDLAPWFDKPAVKLDSDERLHLDRLFRKLEDSDRGTIIPAVEALAQWLTEKVQATATHADGGNYGEAEKEVRAARREILPLRQAMWRTVSELHDLEIQFTPLPSAKAPSETTPYPL
jgi:hypothetical protein